MSGVSDSDSDLFIPKRVVDLIIPFPIRLNTISEAPAISQTNEVSQTHEISKTLEISEVRYIVLDIHKDKRAVGQWRLDKFNPVSIRVRIL